MKKNYTLFLTVLALLLTSVSAFSAAMGSGSAFKASTSQSKWKPEVGFGAYQLTIDIGQNDLLRQVAPLNYAGFEIWGQITPFKDVIGKADIALRFGYFHAGGTNSAKACVYEENYCGTAQSRLSIDILSFDTLLFAPMTNKLDAVIGIGLVTGKYTARANVKYQDDKLVSYDRSGSGVAPALILGVRLNDPAESFTLMLEHRRYTFEDRDNSYMSMIRAGYKFY